MEARITRAVFLAAALFASMGASHRTPNFIIRTASPQYAVQVGETAEKFRRELAVAWIGKEMPNWSAPCVMTVEAGPNLGAGGATSFVFDKGEVFGWRMSIQGSHERILDSVLPHEITHMVFASHFRSPLPRWADEGGATSVEHPSELARHREMLVRFLKTGRGIAFNQMFAMTEYPADVMPLYAQGYSLVNYLIQMKGRRAYVAFLGDGLQSDNWGEAISRHYGISNIGSLQNAWLAWVRQGSPAIEPRNTQPETRPEPELLAGVDRLPRPEPSVSSPGVTRIGTTAPGTVIPITDLSPSAARPQSGIPARTAVASTGPRQATAVLPVSGWHAAGEIPRRTPAQATADASGSEPIHAQTAHPQPIGKPRQTIIQWAQ